MPKQLLKFDLTSLGKNSGLNCNIPEIPLMWLKPEKCRSNMMKTEKNYYVAQKKKYLQEWAVINYEERINVQSFDGLHAVNICRRFKKIAP